MLKKRLDKPNPIRAGGIWDVSRSKRQMETLTRPGFSGPPVGGRSSPEVELIQALVRGSARSSPMCSCTTSSTSGSTSGEDAGQRGR